MKQIRRIGRGGSNEGGGQLGKEGAVRMGRCGQEGAGGRRGLIGTRPFPLLRRLLISKHLARQTRATKSFSTL